MFDSVTCERGQQRPRRRPLPAPHRPDTTHRKRAGAPQERDLSREWARVDEEGGGARGRSRGAACLRGRRRRLSAGQLGVIKCALALTLASMAPGGGQRHLLLGARAGASTEAPNAERAFVFEHSPLERDSQYWLSAGRRALEAALEVAANTERAKSAILFIGDGMSLTTITAARILHGQLMNKSGEEDQLAFDQLQRVALIKTYNLDQQVPDSAATATAILTGVKANFYTLGVNGNVRLNDTNCARIRANQVSSILSQAQAAGKATGIVTNTRITHATPAAAYAHVSNRRWECDFYVPRNLEPPCKDIARQLIEDEPGSRLNVIMGGGRRCFFNRTFIDPGPLGQTGMRQDNLNLIDHWIERRKLESDQNYAFVNSTENLRLINIAKTDHLLGLFSYSHMSYEELRDTSNYGEPSLAEMTEVAIKILSKNPNGYLLLVEGGRIDHAHHENVAGVALRETIALSWAVQTARQLADPQDTLLAVTSDHAQGNPILGLSRYKENATQVPYTTLLYGNGPGNVRPRPDPTQGANTTSSPYYVQFAAVHQEEAFHDGSDVAIFASGPFAHLFQGVQEQSYIAHVFAYAMCIGDYQLGAHCRPSGGASNALEITTTTTTTNQNNNNNNNNDLASEQAFGSSNRAHTYLASDAGPEQRSSATPLSRAAGGARNSPRAPANSALGGRQAADSLPTLLGLLTIWISLAARSHWQP